MADILEKAKGQGSVSGLRQPKQYSTMIGPEARTNNKYSVERQDAPRISGRGKK